MRMTIAHDQAIAPDRKGDASSYSAPQRLVAPAIVGRDDEIALLADALSTTPAVAVVEGEAGIGKTRLIDELSRRPEFAGRRWLVGACRRIREPFPLGPVFEALRGLGEELRDGRLSPVVGALRPFLPELAPWLPLAPDPLEERAAERHRIFRALVEILSAPRSTVLVLEDLHWVDEQTVEFLSYLLADVPRGLSLVLTYRSQEVSADTRALTAKLPSPVPLLHLALAPFDVEQTAALAKSILGAERVSDEFARHLCAKSSGVPFVIEEVLALLHAQGSLVHTEHGWARRTLAELDVPAGVRDLVLERVNKLSDDARAIVETAAVLAVPAPVSTLITVSRATRSKALTGVEQALTSGLLMERGDRIELRHVLAAQAVYESLSGPRRRNLHSRAAEALRAQEPSALVQLARHLGHSGRVDEWAAVAEDAADYAGLLGDADEAARLLEDLLRYLVRDGGDETARERVGLKLARLLSDVLQHTASAIEILSDVATGTGGPPAVRGELRFWLARAIERAGGDSRDKRRLYELAVTDLEERPDLRAWAMAGLGVPATHGVPALEHRKWLDRALEELPRVTTPEFRSLLRGKVAACLVVAGDQRWQDLCRQLRSGAAGAPTHHLHAAACASLGLAAAYSGHHAEADDLIGRALAGAMACENRRLELDTRAARAMLDYCRGRWDDLDVTCASIPAELGAFPIETNDLDVVVGCVTMAHGDVDDAEQRLLAVSRDLDRLGLFDLGPMVEAALMRMALWRSDTPAAVAAVHRFVAGLEAKQLWALVPRALPSAVATLVAANQVDEARALLDRARKKLAGRDAPLAEAAVAHAQGALAHAGRDWVIAGERGLTAAELYAGCGCPYETAQAQELAGLALARIGDDRADATVRAALDRYRSLGADWDVKRCTREARARRMRLAAYQPTGRRGYGDALSPRESEVARLAADGLTNKQIGQELFLSPRTVDKHLMRAMRKLDVHKRAALASRLAAMHSGSTGGDTH